MEVDDCQHNQVNCQNGGFCIDLIDDYRCVCATGSKVSCTCQQEKLFQESFCDLLSEKETNKKEIRVSFDSPVTSHSCHAIFAIHSLIASNEHFCCQIFSPNEVLLKVAEGNPLAQFVTRTIFPHILHLVVNNKALQRTDWSMIDYTIAFICSASVAGLYFLVRWRIKRRQQQSEAQNVIIHCIQNNLKQPGDFCSVSPCEGKKMCNTLQYGSTKFDSGQQQFLPSTKQNESFCQTDVIHECSLSCKLFSPVWVLYNCTYIPCKYINYNYL